jgi:hypothetical protein
MWISRRRFVMLREPIETSEERETREAIEAVENFQMHEAHLIVYAADSSPDDTSPEEEEDDDDDEDDSDGDSDDMCGICNDELIEPQRAPCGHVFCRRCLETRLRDHTTCPDDGEPLETGEERESREAIRALAEYETAQAATTVAKVEEGMCPICKEKLVEPLSTPCAHVFCKVCLETWLEENDTCPIDRTVIE